MKKKKKLRFKKKVLYYFLFLVPVPILIFSTYKIFSWLKETNESNNIIEIIEDTTNVIEYESDDATIIETKENPDTPYWNFIKMNLIDVDFQNLKNTNNDTVGWIVVPNTNINYPVVQTDDNAFYLNHSFDKSKNKLGWLFMDYRNDPANYEKNTIIYAHNTKDKTMFGTLKNVLSEDWFNNVSNRVIKMSSEQVNSLWQIFSIYVIETTNDYITTTFINDTEFNEFVNLIKSRSIHNFDTIITTKDKILTLSTCHGNDKKLVVHAKLIKLEEKNT